MSIQPASLTPSDKALLMMAGAINKNLEKRAKTDQLYKETVQELRDVNQAQAERIQLLEAALELEKHAHQSEAEINQSLQGRVNELIHEKGVLSWEVTHHIKWRAEYYAILCELRVGSTSSRMSALDKCRMYGI